MDWKTVFGLVALIIITMGAWIQHIITCINDAEWLFLIAGAILPFIGMIHGWGIWLGVW